MSQDSHPVEDPDADPFQLVTAPRFNASSWLPDGEVLDDSSTRAKPKADPLLYTLPAQDPALQSQDPAQQAPVMSAHTGTKPGSKPIAMAEGLTKIYGDKEDTQVVALNNIHLTFYTGEFVAIMGPSGSGKSTLMHCMAGLDRMSFGNAVIDGVSLNNMSPAQLTALRRDKIGFIFQSFNLIPTLTAKENILLPANIAGRKINPSRFNQVIQAVGLGDRLTHRPAELSGGQQQRVACARAFVHDVALVFADEPTGNLDSTATESVLTLIRNSVDVLGQGVVMVTHEPLAAAYADRVIFLADGKLAAELQHPTYDTILDTQRQLAVKQAV